MIPKEKAKELIEKFKPFINDWDFTNHIALPEEDVINEAKQCALIAVNEILNIDDESYYNYNWEYWHQVKEEIEKL